MLKLRQKDIKELVTYGHAVDVTHAHSCSDIPESYEQIGYSAGVYGCNGMLFQGRETGKLYAVASRSSAIYIF